MWDGNAWLHTRMYDRTKCFIFQAATELLSTYFSWQALGLEFRSASNQWPHASASAMTGWFATTLMSILKTRSHLLSRVTSILPYKGKPPPKALHFFCWNLNTKLNAKTKMQSLGFNQTSISHLQNFMYYLFVQLTSFPKLFWHARNVLHRQHRHQLSKTGLPLPPPCCQPLQSPYF